MSQSSQTYAALAGHAYEVPQWDPVKNEYREVILNGVRFKPLEYFDRPSGYQGTVYQRIDNGEIVVAHRGTEPSVRDAMADAAMVFARVNPQARDAIELTHRALERAKVEAAKFRSSPAPEITTTGHSLGGTLAQITAHRFHQRGETFNAYGAASLGLGIQPGGHTVLNHVMAGDTVSAGSPHFGQVRIYASEKEVRILNAPLVGYSNDERNFTNPRAPGGAAARMLDSHSVSNFLNEDQHRKRLPSILDDPQAQQRARQYAPMFEKYRRDVQAMREALSATADIAAQANPLLRPLRGAIKLADSLYPPSAPQQPPAALAQSTHPSRAQAISQAMVQATTAAPMSYRDARHPDAPLFQLLRERLPAGLSDERVAQATLACRRSGLHAGNVALVHAQDNVVYVADRAQGRATFVDLQAAAPPLAETMRQAHALEGSDQALQAQQWRRATEQATQQHGWAMQM